MHLAEGTLPLDQALGWSLTAAPILVWSILGERGNQQEPDTPAPLMGGVVSLLFAATLLPLPVPVVGATSHICLTPVLALVVGLRRIIWPTFFVLLLQAVFFAHGGLTTLGINTLTLGALGPLVTAGLWTLFKRMGADNALSLALACGAGGLSAGEHALRAELREMHDELTAEREEHAEALERLEEYIADLGDLVVGAAERGAYDAYDSDDASAAAA